MDCSRVPGILTRRLTAGLSVGVRCQNPVLLLGGQHPSGFPLGD